MFSFSLNKFVVVIIINKDKFHYGIRININYDVYGTTVLTNNDFFLFIVIVKMAPNEIFGLMK